MNRGKILFVLCKTAIFTAVVPFTVGLWLPQRIHWAYSIPADTSNFGRPQDQILALVLLLLGCAIYLWCAWDFSVKGMGTPAPIDAPKILVISGLYRYVRNPMYLGIFCLIISRAFFFHSLPIVWYLLVVVLLVNLFVRGYEEPHLRNIFGEQYTDYCHRVPRWFPRRMQSPEPNH
jgi:protein-S-isoprenylcysteine O-methyltransferase Ste14